MNKHQIMDFGRTSDGRQAHLFSFLDEKGSGFCVTDYGAALTTLLVPDRRGIPTDVLLGFDTVSGYEAHDGFAGAVCGRFANRIKGGRFTLNGHVFQLSQNEGQNHLHGGTHGFDKKLWNVSTLADGYRLLLLSPAGDEGYPGELKAVVSYRWLEGGKLEIRYCVESDRDTICNLTNHAYFNLNGPAGQALDQWLTVNADSYTPTDSEGIPTGEIRSVSGILDLRAPKLMRDVLLSPDPQLADRGGLDHNFVLKKEKSDGLFRAATLQGVLSGICLHVDTDAPGLQVYGGNFIRSWVGKEQVTYGKHAGIALETQLFPDAPNQAAFPTARLPAGEERETRTVFTFETSDA